jgi:protein phosphatase
MDRRIQVAARTHIGSVRKNNEDSSLIIDGSTGDYDTDRLGRMFVIADGMGGHAAGEIASRIACEELRTYYRMEEADAAKPDPSPESAMQKLESVIREANAGVYRNARENRARLGMGTTLSVLLLLKHTAIIGHVGDSRIYLFRNRRLIRLTIDHTRVQTMVDRGYLTAEEAARHPQRHILLEAVGTAESLENVFTRIEPVQKEDAFLLCSDGLTDMLLDSRIEQLLNENPDPRDACNRLLEEALANGGIDNVTVIAMRV